MSIPWVAFSDKNSSGNSDCRGGYKVNPEGHIYKEIIETLIEEGLVEIEDVQDILQYNYNEYKKISKSCYKITYEKEYERVIEEINKRYINQSL